MLPMPRLSSRQFRDIPTLTDDALASSVGVRLAFTGRQGGVSAGPFAALNLGSHVNDDINDVTRNRELLAAAFGIDAAKIVVPNQVHGDMLVKISAEDASSISDARQKADAGADGIVVEAQNVGALLCFADCASVVIVSPSGRFAVAHAGWRGAVAGIAGKAARALSDLDAQAGWSREDSTSGMNAYVGPHIHVECFETGADVCEQFAQRFGADCVVDGHVSLFQAIKTDLENAGLEGARIIDSGICTKCNPDQFFSYRASGGTCGRHGALAFRMGE